MLSRVRYAGLLLLLFLLLFSLQAACISLGQAPKNDQGPAQNTPSGQGSIQDITSRNPTKVSLENAMASLPVAEQEGGIDVTGMTIRQVFGYGVDSSGLARTWVLGMQGEGKTSLLSYSEGGWMSLEMPDISLPEGEVKILELVSPQDLFQSKKNYDLVVQEMNRLMVNEGDLSLSGETYQLTLHSPTESKTFFFNARTGEAISSA